MALMDADPTATRFAGRIMKLGIAGLGVGANTVIDQGDQADFVELVAAADVRPQAVEAFQNRFGARGYHSVEALAKDPDVEVVWVSTPNPLHCEHTVTLLQHGKHVIVEKPMATSLEEAERMVVPGHAERDQLGSVGQSRSDQLLVVCRLDLPPTHAR
jgi:hypothetical protein